MVKTSTVLTVAGVTTAVAAVGYAVWFDQKRRSDADFRKKLRKEKKKISKTEKLAASATSTAAPAREYDFAGALEQLRKEAMPVTAQESEALFLESVAEGDQLAAQGPLFYFQAAVAYYRALRVYRMPTELLGMYQQNVMPPVFALILQLMNHDLKSKAEGYYDHFPPASMGVAVKELPLKKNGVPVEDEPGKPVVRRRALVATKDFAAGDVIYQEHPMVAALDLDLEGKGTHCSNCLRELSSIMSIPVPDDPLGTTYCSQECQLAATSSWHNILFGTKSYTAQAAAAAGGPVPSPVEEEEAGVKRRQAQETFISHVKSSGKVSPLLVGKFFARLISGELSKIMPSEATQAPPNNLPEPDDNIDTGYWEHVERLRFLEVLPTPDEEVESKLLKDMLNGAMAGLDEFVQDDRYLTLKGKVMFNAIGVAYSGGRLNKPKTGARFEAWDLTRTPYGTSRQTGSAFYRVSSYPLILSFSCQLAHSCAPSTRPSFPKGTSELHLVASQDIKAGDELTMSYVRSTPVEGETPADNRRTRRQELARGWRFVCECTKCSEELAAMGGAAAFEETKSALEEAAAAETTANDEGSATITPAATVEASTEADAKVEAEAEKEGTNEPDELLTPIGSEAELIETSEAIEQDTTGPSAE
ncbi:MAS20-domain-containing protein [Clavulina sp. PMI_390]|nr:MAS20-domain-containing protein [Clavulina sp. PMI_390]